MTATSDFPEADAINRAVEVFLHGFSFTRSRTHPYLVERVESMSVLRDAPRKRGDYRTEEWVAYGVASTEMDRIARENTRGRFTICAFCGVDEPQEPLRSGFKTLDYRLGRTEPLMVHPLSHIPDFASPALIERMTTAEMAGRLAQVTRSRPLPAEFLLMNSPLRQYVAMVDDELVGWVSSVVVGDATWCSNMYVSPSFRRRGIARSLLCRMLHDDRAAGAQTAVLLASHAGAKLYPVVGYEQIATLFLFTPKNR
jgi:GNAT superfamily N-acetyltransferase